jgi:hypothetical protein
MKKKLMVAGCSFSAPSRTLPGTSWSEVMADRLGWELINLARQGCSNGGIRIQIEEIRRQQPDFAVVSATFWDRMEIPARAAPYDWTQSAGGWDPKLQQHLQDRTLKNGYNRIDGINNVNYGNNNYNMICETIFSLAENYDHPYRSGKIDKHSQQGVRAFIDTIYDNEWKKQQDEWIIREGIMQMYLDGIKFLFLPNLLWPFDPNNSKQWRDAFPRLIPDHYLQLDPMRTPQVACGQHPCDSKNDPGYHGNNASQELIADWHLAYMKNGFSIE